MKEENQIVILWPNILLFKSQVECVKDYIPPKGCNLPYVAMRSVCQDDDKPSEKFKYKMNETAQ